MKYRQHQLANELRQAGATTAELKRLLPIASRLSLLKESMARPRWFRYVQPVLLTATGLALGMVLIVMSQAVLPTSWLYPVQKFSDNVAVGIHPQYRASIMMKRAQQVNALVANHASSRQVLATLADYTAEANTYKAMPHANYAAFEYCKTNLQQAAAAAAPPIRQTINDSLKSLETT